MISLPSKELSRVFSSPTIQKHQFFSTQLSWWSISHIPTWLLENHSLSIWTFVGRVMSLLLNMLSRFVIAFLPKSQHLLILWLKSQSTVILEHKKIKSVIASTFPPSIFHEVMGLDAMISVFWMLSFKPTFSLSSFTIIKRLFSFCSIPVTRVVLSAYLRLLIFPPAILILACDSSSLAFLMMSSAYKLNKQGDNIQPCHPPFPILNQLFHVQFKLLLLDPQTGFSGDR